MSHNRDIIIQKVREVFAEPAVQEQASAQFPASQCARISQICAETEPCDEDFRFLTRKLNQLYCTED